MAKKAPVEIRDHSAERAWLLNLGKGNIFEGVQNLLQNAAKEKDEKSKKKTGS